MSVVRGTTPTISLTFSATKYPQLDLTTASVVLVTFTSGIKKVTKQGDDLVIGARSIGVFLNQRDTLQFDKTAEMQANWLTADGKRCSTKAISFEIDKQLEDRVISVD